MLKRQANAVVVTVSSGLAFVPLSLNPTYCATKAAIHSYTQSLRYRLRDDGIQVIEIVPPDARTRLQGERQANDPNAMPLEDYIRQTIANLHDTPDCEKILVDRVNPLRLAEARGHHDDFYANMNEMLRAARTKG